MKTCKSTCPNWLLLILVCAVLGMHAPLRATTATWTGGAGDLLWSSALNWDINAPPAFFDSVVFGNGGATNSLGAVNNIVTASLTISNLSYNALANSGFYHTTLINPGQTLTLDCTSTNSIERLLNVEASLGTNDQIYATIKGANGGLVLGQLESPQPNHTIYISLMANNTVAATCTQRATVDLSALDNFTFAGGFISVAGSGSSGANNQPAGTFLLAKTNVITANRASSSTGTIRVSHNPGGNATGAAENLLELGQENTINTIYLRVGGDKALNGGAMRFRSGLINPTLKLRGTNGLDGMPLLTIGDNWDTATGVKSTGVVDLSGGTVDASVDTLHVARTFNNGSSTSSSGSGDGTLTFTAGTMTVDNVYLGCQGRNNRGTGTGVINVGGNATLVVGTLYIANDRGTELGTGIGTLNIDGGTVTVSGDIVENDASATVSGADGSSTIHITNNGVLNLQPPGDLAPGNITVDTLNFSSGTFTNYGTLGLNTVNVLSPATDFTVYPGQALTAVGSGNSPVGTLTVNGNLLLTNATLHCELDNALSGDLVNVSGTLTLAGANQVDINMVNGNLAVGDYILMTYGSGLAGGASNLQVGGLLAGSRYTFAFSVNPYVTLTVGGAQPGSVSLTWAGDGAGNLWDLTNSVNWNANTEKFYQFDPVLFDDTSSQTNVNLVGTLAPASVTVNATQNYTLAGPGRITGSTGLTNLGTGKLFLQTSNDYTGTTVISAGTVVIGDGGTNGSVLPPIINDGALVFNRSDEYFYSGAISGSGSLAQIGSGGLRLNVAATYAGPTTVENGWLRISSGNNRLPTGTVLTLGSAGAVGKFYMGITTAAYSQQLAGLASAGLGGSVVNGGHSDITEPTYSTLTLNTAGDYLFAGRLGGDVTNENNIALVKTGTGKQTLSGMNTYTNTTTISTGTLALSGSGSIAGSSVISVSSGATFDVSVVTGGYVLAGGQTLVGSGMVNGGVTVAAGATLSPGTGIGTLTINGDLTLTADSTNLFEVHTDTLAHDLVTGLNQVTYSGTLFISPSGSGTAVTNGASVKLFNAANYSGAFAAIVPAVPAPGLVWDPSGLTVDGTLKVVSGISTTPTNLVFAVAGNALDISWPADHVGWRLEGQTNSIGVGLSNNWFTVPGSADTNHMILPIGTANGAVFYRLVYP